VVGDLQLLFPQVRHLPQDAPSRWTSQFTRLDETGTAHTHRARFVHGLLQEVSPVAD
jgi:hypothetical protein